jgi:hypothetical protein
VVKKYPLNKAKVQIVKIQNIEIQNVTIALEKFGSGVFRL